MNTRHRDKLQKNVFFKECVKLSINTKSMILLKSQLITSCNKKKYYNQLNVFLYEFVTVFHIEFGMLV